jgi:signal transduction histidine kinase/ActR/RegA family two-component response regulator
MAAVSYTTMNKNIFHTIITRVRNNGIAYVKDPKQIKKTVYMNMIWLVTYSTFCMFTILFFSIVGFGGSTFNMGIALIHLGFISTFLITRYFISELGRHLLLITTYGMIAFLDHFFGKEAFMQVYFIAFLPTALNIFSFRRHRVFIFLYIFLPMGILLFSEIYTYHAFPANAAMFPYIPQIRLFNIITGFALAILFASYIILATGKKQERLITQSVSLQATLNNAIGAIWSIDREYVLLACNKQFVNFLRSVLDVQYIKPGMSLVSILANPKMPETIRKFYKGVMEGKSFSSETSFDGEFYEWRGQPIINEHGKIIGGTFSGRNITFRKKNLKRLEEANKQAEVAVAAKARFLSIMSHELRTPLNGIIGIVNIMQDEPVLPAQENNLATLNDLSQHTLQLINNILDYSKLEAGKSALNESRFNLRSLIYRLQSIFEVTARLKKFDLLTEINGNADIHLKGDYTKLSQVLINLLSNAVKFTEKGFVKLVVTVAPAKKEGAIKVHFAVKDTGIGIPENSMKLIFESFTQADEHTSRKFGGTGLGITISEKILHLMKSKLVVESEPGKGSVFSFEITLEQSSVANRPLKKTPGENNQFDPLPGLKVLLAEDNIINQRVAKMIIEKWGATVIVAGNGAEALEQFNSRPFDIILMDLDMPVMDGYEAVAVIRETNNQIPIVALTAATFDEMNEHLQKKGFTQVIQKPFAPRDLYAAIVSLGVKNELIPPHINTTTGSDDGLSPTNLQKIPTG